MNYVDIHNTLHYQMQFRPQAPQYVQWALMPDQSARKPHASQDVVYVSQCVHADSTARELSSNIPTFYRQRTKDGDELDPAVHNKNLLFENIQRERPLCYYGYSKETEAQQKMRLPDLTAEHIPYNNLRYHTEDTDAGHEFICQLGDSSADPSDPPISRKRRGEDLNPPNDLKPPQPGSRVVSPITDIEYFHQQELSCNPTDRRDIYDNFYAGAKKDDLMTVTSQDEPAYVDLLYIPPLAQQPDVIPLGGTIVYYETVEGDSPESRPKMLQIRSQSYVSPNNVLIPAGIDSETGVDRLGVRERIPDELTAYSRLPASPDYRPDPQDVDEGIETSDEELDTSPAVMQVY